MTLEYEHMPPSMREAVKGQTWQAQSQRYTRVFDGFYRVNDNAVYMQAADWFLTTLLFFIKHSSTGSHRRYKNLEDYLCDYFYEDMTRVPCLVLFRRILTHFAGSHSYESTRIMRKLIFLAQETFLVDPQLPLVYR
jgi:hypothetical protein